MVNVSIKHRQLKFEDLESGKPFLTILGEKLFLKMDESYAYNFNSDTKQFFDKNQVVARARITDVQYDY